MESLLNLTLKDTVVQAYIVLIESLSHLWTVDFVSRLWTCPYYFDLFYLIWSSQGCTYCLQITFWKCSTVIRDAFLSKCLHRQDLSDSTRKKSTWMRSWEETREKLVKLYSSITFIYFYGFSFLPPPLPSFRTSKLNDAKNIKSLDALRNEYKELCPQEWMVSSIITLVVGACTVKPSQSTKRKA